MDGVRLSLVVITRDEERNLPNLLRSTRGLADETIVVDSESRDGTRDVARSFGARAVPFPVTPHVDEARATALSEAKGDWILSLDADELITPALARRIRAWMDDPGQDAYLVPRLNHAMGEPILGGGWGPDDNRPLALFRHGTVTATRHVHAFYHLAPGTRVARPPYVPGEHIVHFGTHTMESFLAKVNRYSSLVAIDARERPAHPLPGPRQALAAAARRFAFHYWRLGGRRDGWRGLVIAATAAYETLVVHAKMQEDRAGLDGAAIRARYQAIADEVLAAAEKQPFGAPST